MKKIAQCLTIIAVLLFVFLIGNVIADKQALQSNLIRLHVVANSDHKADQQNKLLVRDSVRAYLNENMQNVCNVSEARLFFEAEKANIENIANNTLRSVNAQYCASVSFVKEEFPMREYDTFSLPAGIYNAIKIELGSANGKNWWCVAFPELCLPATSSEFSDLAVEAGIQEDLANTIADPETYEIRFFLLECLGKLENFFHFG